MGMIKQPSLMKGKEQLIPVGSPYYVTSKTIGKAYDQVSLKLWIWSGDYRDKVNSSPDYTFVKDKISLTDANITFEISDYIKHYIKPVFNDKADNINGLFTGESCWVYYELEYFSKNVSGSISIMKEPSELLWATLGYNWNYEDYKSIGDTGAYLADGTNNTHFIQDENSSKHYHNLIAGVDYINRTTLNYASTTSDGVIVNTKYVGKKEDLVCAKDPYIIYFLNKKGLFEMFTTVGKVSVSNTYQSESYRKTYSDSSRYNQRHYMRTYNIDSTTEWTINTGLIHPVLANKVEEIISSSVIYIKEFNTKQVYPVAVKLNELNRKTRINDKSKIVYTLNFVDTSNKIRSIV